MVYYISKEDVDPPTMVSRCIIARNTLLHHDMDRSIGTVEDDYMYYPRCGVSEITVGVLGRDDGFLLIILLGVQRRGRRNIMT